MIVVFLICLRAPDPKCHWSLGLDLSGKKIEGFSMSPMTIKIRDFHRKSSPPPENGVTRLYTPLPRGASPPAPPPPPTAPTLHAPTTPPPLGPPRAQTAPGFPDCSPLFWGAVGGGLDPPPMSRVHLGSKIDAFW